MAIPGRRWPAPGRACWRSVTWRGSGKVLRAPGRGRTAPGRGPAGSSGLGYSRGVTDNSPDASPGSSPDPAAQPPTVRAVEYKGAPLDSERGPGLGCFYIQLIVLGVVVILTPLTVVWGWPAEVSMALLFLVVLLLLLTGQTIIFLLRLVAADRRAAGRRRPLASATRTVGELEDERQAAEGASSGGDGSAAEGDGSAAEGEGSPGRGGDSAPRA